jgi:hypothetical protein
VDTISIAGSDIVKKISEPKPKVESFRERGVNVHFFKNLREMREKLVKSAGILFFYLIMCVHFSR